MANYTDFKYKNTWLSSYNNAFIINSGDDLKFFNQSNFNQDFTTPQFGNQSYFLGTTMENREFNFNITLPEITLSEYKEFLSWLDPRDEGILVFDYNQNYGYEVKVNSIGEGTFYVVPNCPEENKYNIEIQVGFITKNDWAAKNLNENNSDFKFLPIEDSGNPNSTDPLIYYESILNTREIFRIDYITDEYGLYEYHTFTNNLSVDNYFELKLICSSTVFIADGEGNNIISFEVTGVWGNWYSRYGIVLDQDSNFQSFNHFQESAIVKVPANSSINIKIFPELDGQILEVKPTLREII